MKNNMCASETQKHHAEFQTGHNGDRMLRRRAVMDRVGLSFTTIWRLYRRGLFPRPVRLSPGTVGWRESEITAWLEQRESIAR
jgi:prophage regulatory protein